MSDLDVLRELRTQIRPPRYEDLIAAAQRRRRRSRVGAAVAAAVLVLGIGTAGAALSGGEVALVPAQVPSPSPTGPLSIDDEWPLERIRDEGSGEVLLTTASGLSAHQYLVCDGPGCHDTPVENWHVALEVTQDGRSALFDVFGRGAWVGEFDDDSLLVQDADPGTPDDEVRFRLLQADGRALQLRRLDDPAPAVAGPGVLIVDDLDGWSIGLVGVEVLYLVNDSAGTLQPVDSPAAVRYWGPNVDEFLWGVTDDCRVFWANSGTFQERRLDCDDHLDFTALDQDIFPSGWLRPGRLAVTEQFDEGDRMAVHVSLDYGVSWQRVPVADAETAADVLRQSG